MRVYTVRRAGHKRAEVLTFLNGKAARFIGFNLFNLIYLIGNCLPQDRKVKVVTQLKLIKVSKHGRAWQAAVCTNYAMRTLATHGKRRALQVTRTLRKHVSTRTVVDRQIYINARDGYGTHHAIGTKGQLTGIGGVFFGRVNSKSVRDAFAHERLVVGTGTLEPILRVIL